MKKKRKTSLTAMGAVVAAGLGIATTSATAATPAVTAADVVAIDGQEHDFGELLDQQLRAAGGSKADTVAAREQARRDSIRRMQEQQQQHRLVYGPPRPIPKVYGPPPPRTIDANDVQRQLIDCCTGIIDAERKGINIGPDSRLTRDMGMDPNQVMQLTDEIGRRFGVKLTAEQLEQLATLSRIAEQIVKSAQR